jgi:hypothetical protein
LSPKQKEEEINGNCQKFRPPIYKLPTSSRKHESEPFTTPQLEEALQV